MSETTTVTPARRGRPRKAVEAPQVETTPGAEIEDEAVTETETPRRRGPLTPAQFDDDGWKNLPVQMRNRP